MDNSATEGNGTAPEMQINLHNDLTEEQAAKMREWGYDPSESASPDEAAIQGPQQDVFGGQVKMTDYQFDPAPHGLEPMPLEQQVEVRQALAAAGVPAEIGREFGKRWNTAMSAGPQTDEQLALGMAVVRAQIEAKYGAQAAEVVKLAQAEAQRVIKGAPWVQIALSETQLGNDLWVIETLANLGRARQTTASAQKK